MSLGVAAADQAAQWAATDDRTSACVRLVGRSEGALVGYMAWPTSLNRLDVRAHIAIQEDSPGAEAAAQAFLHRLSESVPIGGAANIHLSCPTRQVVLREVAASFGYTASPSAPTELMKISLKQHVRASSWGAARQSLLSAAAMQLPDNPPLYRHVDQQVPVIRRDGQQMHVSIFQLESHLAPALLCLQGRGGVMVPIQRRFEESLIAQSPQVSWLPMNKAQLRPQRLYVSGPNTLKSFQRGDLIFFYESSKDKGSRSVIAIGRVLRAFHRGQGESDAEDLSGSVLTEDQLSEIGTSTTKTITVFDNVLRLSRPVVLEDLKALGCGAPQQLLTTQRLSVQQVQGILEKGFQ
jgi:predicted RNA-binding protein with PUA-like domain